MLNRMMFVVIVCLHSTFYCYIVPRHLCIEHTLEEYLGVLNLEFLVLGIMNILIHIFGRTYVKVSVWFVPRNESSWL